LSDYRRNRAHPAPIALWASNGSPAHDCTLEAMRTQEAIFFGSYDDVNDSFD
jgi:hypothetical protein